MCFQWFKILAENADYIETPYGSNPDKIQYNHLNVVRHTLEVSGFFFKHSHGATITALFDKPIVACESTVDEDGDEIEYDSSEDRLEKAIVAKLGPISGLREVNLI